jgi:adenylosuccinate lyase
MGRIWTDQNRLQIWMEVELMAVEAMAQVGLVEKEIAVKLRSLKWEITEQDVAEVAEIEKVTRHDIIAFLTHLERKMGPEARYLHMGMTSSDLLDTTFAVQLKKASEMILAGVAGLKESIGRQAQKYRHTPMVGRTHGIHAEPTTFGLVLAIWYQELNRHQKRIEAAKQSISFGKISGAVGTFAHLPLDVEEQVCLGLGLEPAPVSNQIIQRDRHAELFLSLANLAATLEKISVNIRHFQRTEVGEVAESFAHGQRGSSAMPHKKNPIGCENLTGVARLLRSNAMAALENVALWHERDISHSSVERVIAPDSTILIDYALARMTRIIDNLRVDQGRMRKNLELTQGLVFSQSVLLAIIKAGMEREKAYEVVQQKALMSWDLQKPLLDLLLEDREVVEIIGEEKLKQCFDPDKVLSRVDEIFKRVFG